jgi:CMP-N-acetylneuraminic acid synthetase
MDTTSTLEVIKHALVWVKENIYEKFDHIILLQPTSPLRKVKHIDEAINHFSKNKKNYKTKLISAFKIDKKYNLVMMIKSNLYCNFISNYIDIKNMRRQKTNELLLPNGAIFISTIRDIKSGFYNRQTLFFLMKKKNSVDIDTLRDLNNIK